MLLCMGGDLTCTVMMGRVKGLGIEKMSDLLSRRMRPCGKEHERVVVQSEAACCGAPNSAPRSRLSVAQIVFA